MSLLQLLLIACGLMAIMVLGWSVLSGPNPTKEGGRRLQAVRYRHSDSAIDKVEAQLRKAVAARKPKAHQIAGSNSRIQALELRLHRTGMRWTLSQYLYASLGLSLTITLVMFIKTHAAMLSLGVGLVVGAGLPHMIIGFAIKRRINRFITKFPDAIDLLDQSHPLLEVGLDLVGLDQAIHFGVLDQSIRKPATAVWHRRY